MLQENIATAKANIERVGGHNVTIVAATKTVAPEIINRLPAFGITIAGENRVQELLSKYDNVNGVIWHFIGRLQRNKVKYIVDKVAMIHSVDSIALAQEIEKHCVKLDKIMPVLIEINDGEENKGGVLPDKLAQLCDCVASLPHLALKGIMCVLPKAAPEAMYEDIYEKFLYVKSKYPAADILSMGMSGDYETAVRHGANMVRLGTCLFGQRI